MKREEAVQQAREWRDALKGSKVWSDERVAAYAADRLKAELEALAKEMCDLCAHGVELNGRDHFQPAAIGGIYSRCAAAPIRARLALWEGEK